jgi:hypothetical protein
MGQPSDGFVMMHRGVLNLLERGDLTAATKAKLRNQLSALFSHADPA